jgi:hypothetical protein
VALTTRRVAAGEFFGVTVTFDDVTGVISHLDWTVASGTLTVTIHQDGKADLTRTITANGGMAVPPGQGYVMTPNPKGGWSWVAPISFEMAWSSV